MQGHEERLETELRRRLQAALRGNGWTDEAVAKEVNFWLPPLFVRWYRDARLAGTVMDRSLGAKSGAGQRPTGDEAEVKAVVASRYKGKRVGAGVGGAGKRYVEGSRVILDEDRVEVLGRVDRFLERIALSDGRLTDEKVGKIVSRRVAGRVKLVCDECGKFMRSEWVRCPYHEV